MRSDSVRIVGEISVKTWNTPKDESAFLPRQLVLAARVRHRKLVSPAKGRTRAWWRINQSRAPRSGGTTRFYFTRRLYYFGLPIFPDGFSLVFRSVPVIPHGDFATEWDRRCVTERTRSCGSSRTSPSILLVSRTLRREIDLRRKE